MHQLYSFLFSPEGGGWGYSFIGPPGPATFLVMVALIPATLVILRAAEQSLDQHEWLVVAGVMAYGLGVQLALRSLAPTSLGAVVASRGANGFLDVARTYGAADLLARFQAIAGGLPMHVRANLPGKTLFFDAMLALTNSPQVMGLLILVSSTLGTAMVYFLARQWFGDRRTALIAAVLYLFVPARLYFMPVLNVITPIFLLLPICLIEIYLTARRPWALVAAGVASYALVMFEPLPLAAAPVVAVQILRRLRADEISWRDVAAMAAFVAGGLLLTHILFVVAFGFNIVDAFQAALADARAFNAATGRPYWLWAGHDVKDFLLHMGVAQSALILFALFSPGLRNLAGGGMRWALVSVLVILAVLGINRGEIVRLWIFLGVLWQIGAAPIVAARPGNVRIVLSLTVIQTALLMSMVRWLEVESFGQ